MKKILPKHIIFATVFLDVLGIGIIIPVLPFYLVSFGASTKTITLLFTIFAICAFFSAPILGAISDRKGRRPVLLVSLLSSAIGWLVFAFSHSLLGLFIGRIIDGIAAGNISTAQNYLIDISADEKERAQNLGAIGAMFGIGFILGPVFGSFLAHVYPPLPFIIVGILATLNVVCAYFFLPETHHHRNEEKLSLNPFTPIGKAFAPGPLRKLFLGWLIFGVAISINQIVYPLYLHKIFGFGTLGVGLSMALVGVVVALNQAVLLRRFWFKKFTPAYLNIAILLPFAFGYLIMGVPYLVCFGIALIVTAFGQGLFRATMMNQIVSHAEKKKQGEVVGTSSSVLSLSMILGPLLGGYAYDIAAYLPFVMAAVLLVVVYIVLKYKRIT